ncbi:hypothetical protein HELRODRAFT_177606 [Helobdella robusta]|uniref:Peptidase M1 membrane alanine aminopeptidase domain-containing protein n=1 Tax=Helobdella robusta TaxID=6412 RepID=T1FBX7_HELRO|nr:hypothetical protein HELRODRAFT_177606 [Helobdella robusta]ESN97941.1 hypothetical protein HELRODRAFT_177606 [Helobdella robusta]
MAFWIGRLCDNLVSPGLKSMQCKFKPEQKTDHEVTLYAPANAIIYTDVPLDTAVKLIDFYENIAFVHLLSVGSMANWGLMIFDYKYLHYEPLVNEEYEKQILTREDYDEDDDEGLEDSREVASDKDIVTFDRHLFNSHLQGKWFGSLVTMKWWDDFWLYKAFEMFQQYFGADFWLYKAFEMFQQYFGADHLLPGHHMREMFFFRITLASLLKDNTDYSSAISVSVENHKLLSKLFDNVKFSKGASIIQMLESVIGPEIFQKAVKNFLTEHEFKSAKSSDLWESFTKESSGSLNIDVKEMMDTWTQQMGFPLVSISRNGRQVTCRQERYVVVNHSKTGDVNIEVSKFNYTWYIPLTYITDKNLTRHSVVIFKNKTMIFQLPRNVNWLKVNTKMPGFYRVNYDMNGWSGIINQLKSNHKVFSSIERSSLISDAFTLARFCVDTF